MRSPISTLTLLLLLAAPALLRAQPQRTAPPQTVDTMTSQLVDSRRGYVIRIPGSARLDSAHSGWSPKAMFERRVYTIKGVGEIVLTAWVKPIAPPDSAHIDPAYTYNDHDSSTGGGTAQIRTWYLPTRAVRIEIVPHAMAMRSYLDATDRILGTFRWKPGATTDALDVDPPEHPPVVPELPKTNTLGGGGK